MKKKHLNIPLFILVFIIYGGVFFKFFGKKGMQLEDAPYNTFSKQVSNFETKRNDFDISNIKSDPFGISEKRSRKVVSNVQSNVNKNLITKTSTEIAWPKITYYGFVKNKLNTTRLVLVKVNNKLHRKRENEKIDDITIVKAYNDSITLRLNKTTKTILKINE